MRVQILAITADMSQADILQALRTFTATQQAPEPPAKSLPPPAPPIQPPGEPPRRINKVQPPKTGVSNLVRQALQEGPKSAGAIRDWLRSHNHPNLTKGVAAVLCSLIKQGEAQRDPNTGLCRLITQ